MASDLGDGFFVKLGLKTDKDSFEKGQKAIDGLTNSFDRLVSGVKNAAPVLAAAMAGTFETAELKAAKSIGISTEALDSWKVAAGMAGTSASALTSSMASLEQKMQGLKIGQVDQNLAKNLGFLGIGYKQFADMDASQRMSSVFKAAQAMQDQSKAALLVQNVLGSAGADYYNYLQLSGTTLEHELEIGRSLTFTNDESKRKAMEFNHELQGVYSAGKSIGMLFGSEVGAALTPTIKQFREWLGANNELITSGITGFVGTLGEYFNKLVTFIEKGAPKLKEIVESAGGLDKIIVRFGLGMVGVKVLQIASGLSGIMTSLGPIGTLLGGLIITGTLLDPSLMEGLAPKLKKTFDDVKKNAFDPLADSIKNLITSLTDSDSFEEGLDKIENKLLEFSKNTVDAVLSAFTGLNWGIVGIKAIADGDQGKVNTSANKMIDAAANIFGFFGEDKKQWFLDQWKDSAWRDEGSTSKQSTHDGIISPGGHLTQVDPNDWVFAAKDVGALATAFIPRGNYSNVNAPSQYIINQTFNVSGSKDLPQTLRQQAYKGTQEGLASIMQRNTQRMQLMTGTL